MSPSPEKHNPLTMRNIARSCYASSLLRLGSLLAPVLLLLAVMPFHAQTPKLENAGDPLPQDTGTQGLKQMLRRLNTTARFMQVVAHPDDEDGDVLTLESRGKGASVVLLTLNRGEGGQNKIGSNLFDVLGVVRTLELLASDRYYGVEDRFTRVADFGYSKNPEETFQKWGGHDIPLGDLVRVIRTFRPDVLVARFSGTSRDGHGHHQASSILTREAFRAAADPNRFPEQIKEGLQPWQPAKVYIGNVCGFGARTCADENYTVKIDTGVVDPLLKTSYLQFAIEGLRHQLSQGAGNWNFDLTDRLTFYKLVDSVLSKSEGHEQDVFDGIDTSLPGLASRLGAEQAKVPFLRPALVELQSRVSEAGTDADRDPASAAAPLLTGLQTVRNLLEEVNRSKVSPPAKEELLLELRTKEHQFERAADLATGTDLHVVADVPTGSNPDNAFMGVPGHTFDVTAHFTSRTPLELSKIQLDLPSGWSATQKSSSGSGVDSTATFRLTIPDNAQYTRPYWHRDDPQRDALNTIDDPDYVTLPFPPPPVQAHAVYAADGKQGIVRTVAMVKYKGTSGAELERPVAVAPAFSVMLEPGQQVIPMQGDAVCAVKVAVSSNLSDSATGALQLEVPAGWRPEPKNIAMRFQTRAEKREAEFKVFHDGMTEGRTQIRAVFTSGGKAYSEGYTVVTRDDLDTAYYYQPALQHVSIVNVKVPRELRVGYIMGAGDDIPTVLQQIGMNVTLIPAEQLSSENLGQYGTIVLGIRAYDTQPALMANNKKLLDFVAAGGTLVAQYNTGVADFNKGNFAPYSAQLSRARVSVEEAPVDILAPEDSVFHYPNQISEQDFDDWVQERGLYFMGQWDSTFKPLLASNDPGESPQKGGLLRAQYGKGMYIYTGYAFFRQLPAGVPGAIRLYVNLLSAGHESRSQ